MLKFYESFKSIFLLILPAVIPVAFGLSAAADPGFNNNRSVPNDTIDTTTLVSKAPLRIESLSTNSLCGRTFGTPNERVCIGEFPTEVSANDTISKLKYFALAEGQNCAVDERGVQCWKTRDVFNQPVKSILASGDASMLRSDSSKICIPKADKTVVCHNAQQGEWTSVKTTDGSTTNSYKKVIPADNVYGPFRDLRDFQVVDGTVCALDGDEVVCPGADALRIPVPKEKFPGAKSLSIFGDTVCVLHSSGLTCLKGEKGNENIRFELGEWWSTASKLFPAGYESLCAVDDKDQPRCIKLGLKSDDITDVTPNELTAPGVRILKFMAHGERKCALVQKESEPRSLLCGNSSLDPVPRTESVTDFSMNADVTCSLEKNGWVSCTYNTLHMDSPLPEDGSEVDASGLCRWNSSRFHCARLDIATTNFSDVKKVIGVGPNSSRSTYPCVIFETTSGARSVRCYDGWSSVTDNEAPIPTEEHSKVVSGHGMTCLYGGETTTCWGDKIGNTDTPNISNAKKIGLSSDFGCAIDQFGLICWGRNMEERQLVVPPGFGDLDFITDFSLGDSHVCAITRESRLACWGQNEAGQLNYPQVTNPVSIASSGDTNCVSSDEGVTCWGSRTDDLMNGIYKDPSQ